MGHLFVAQGDLTKLACDTLVIPCDEKLNVNISWAPILPVDTRRVGRWLRIAGTANACGVIKLPDAGNRSVRAFQSPYVGYAAPDEPVDRLWTALLDVDRHLEGGRFRPKPLIGIPLVGTGDGGLAHRRGEVIAQLLARHRTDQLRADLALVLSDPRDLAAVQNERKFGDWPELEDALQLRADGLGRLAADKELSLFLGAGVSRPAGLPDWPGLLELLAQEAGMQCPPLEAGFEEAAIPIKKKLGADYVPVMRKLVDAREHAVGHALLAGLRVGQMVTTNFDPCLELALESTHHGGFRVLVRELAEGGKPWLLKLHGDIRQPDSLILDTEDLERHSQDGAALRGVVQSLLLTGHLLFVGFSFKDADFLSLARAVTKIRNSADCGSENPVGTALALTQSDADSVDLEDLETVVMLETGPEEAARKLEIFLDRLGWAAATNHPLAAEYLLDWRYESALSNQDRRLSDLLTDLMRRADAATRASSGWSRVASCLRDLGATDAEVAGTT
jgi:hypothetical protein